MISFYGLSSLFFFSMASAGFILCLVRYPNHSQRRLWGIRACHVFGFLGVGLLRLATGHFSDNALLIISSLIVSLVAFEISQRYLTQELEK